MLSFHVFSSVLKVLQNDCFWWCLERKLSWLSIKVALALFFQQSKFWTCIKSANSTFESLRTKLQNAWQGVLLERKKTFAGTIWFCAFDKKESTGETSFSIDQGCGVVEKEFSSVGWGQLLDWIPLALSVKNSLFGDYFVIVMFLSASNSFSATPQRNAYGEMKNQHDGTCFLLLNLYYYYQWKQFLDWIWHELLHNNRS